MDQRLCWTSQAFDFGKNVADLWHDLLGHEIAAAVSVTVAVAFEECFCH